MPSWSPLGSLSSGGSIQSEASTRLNVIEADGWEIDAEKLEKLLRIGNVLVKVPDTFRSISRAFADNIVKQLRNNGVKGSIAFEILIGGEGLLICLFFG